MGLVTMEQAKVHLNVFNDDHDADVQLKLEHASAIILDYLKSQADRRSTVTSSSVASPTVITTSTAHGYSNGETVIISSHTGSTPAISGSYVVSSVTEFTFTIPVAVTVAGTGGLALVAWTPDTAPGQVQSATLLMLGHLYEHRGDDPDTDDKLWAAIDRLLMRSRDPAYA
jgi:hypothetical protein